MDTIGSRIRAARKNKGYTMQQLHEVTGLSTGNISDIENDRYAPSVSALLPIRRALGCTIDWLLSGENLSAPKSEHIIECDGVPLSESEGDLLAMYRLLDAPDKRTIFDLTKLKYEQMTGEKVSIYSTYSDTNPGQKNGPDDDENIATGTA